jgi:MurNAc alpha-1-phosphate uridylyltransferase
MTKVNQAFIFAAGRGQRMQHITDLIPKSLIKIKNKALIDYIIEKLDQISAIKKIIINGFYFADQIEAHIQKLNNPKIIFSRETKKVETGGGLLFARDKIDFNRPLLLINSDVLWREENSFCDIKNICQAWEDENQNEAVCDLLLGLKKTEEYLGYEGNIHGGGDFYFLDKKLFRIPDQPMTHVFVGLQIINPKILEKVPKECFSMSYFYKSGVGEKGRLHRIKGFELQGRYFHVGTPEAIMIAEEKF